MAKQLDSEPIVSRRDSACSSRPRLHGHTLVGAWEQGLIGAAARQLFAFAGRNDGSPGMCFTLFGLLCNSEPVLPVLQLDNAGWHTPENLPVPDGIRLVYQPPRTPELQPAEHLWPLIDEPLANKHFGTIEDLDAAIAERYCDLAGKKSLIASHTKFHCITINDPRIAPTRLAASGSQRIELRTLLALGSVAVRAEGKCLLGNSRLGFSVGALGGGMKMEAGVRALRRCPATNPNGLEDRARPE